MKSDPQQAKQRLRKLAWFMDQAIPIPLLNRRIGLDGIIGLIPFVGDALSTLISGYLVTEAARLGASKTLLLRMCTNVFIDTIAGSIPLVGDLFDFAWKSNQRNIKLLDRHLTSPTRSRRGNTLWTILIIVFFLAILIGLLWLIIAILGSLWSLITG